MMEAKEIPSSVLSRLPVSVWTTDRDLHLTSCVNGSGLDSYFPCPSAVIPEGGRFSYDLTYILHPDISAHLRARQGETVSWRTGPEGSMAACVGPLRGPDGAIIGVIGVVVDQGRIHEEIRRRQRMERLLYSVLGTVPALVSVLDEEGHVVFANRGYLEALGKSENEVLGCNEDELFRQCGINRRMSFMDEREGSVESPRAVMEWENGKRDVFRSRKLSLCGEKEESGMVLHISSKVTESASPGAELATMATRCEKLLSALGHPAFVCSSQGIIEAVNEEWCAVLGAARHEVVGSSALCWSDGSSADSFRSLWEENQVAQSLRTWNILFKAKGGGAILATLTASPLTRLGEPADTLLVVKGWGDPAAHLESCKKSPQVSGLDARILELLAVGKSNAEISSSLCLSRQGLDYRLKNLRRQLDATSRGALVARAYAHGLFQHEDWPPRCRSPYGGDDLS
ncbi:hypothetical protein CTZ27_35355 [Streptomyces griseocarneus]|nr:hypothetical protein CTZ27_35355 [Streptomyces griseocarneus]